MKQKRPLLLLSALLLSHVCIVVLLLYVEYRTKPWIFYKADTYYIYSAVETATNELIDQGTIELLAGKNKGDVVTAISTAIRDPQTTHHRNQLSTAVQVAVLLGLLNVILLFSMCIVGYMRNRRHRNCGVDSDAIASG